MTVSVAENGEPQLRKKRGRLTSLCVNNEAEKRPVIRAEGNHNPRIKEANNYLGRVFYK